MKRYVLETDLIYKKDFKDAYVLTLLSGSKMTVLKLEECDAEVFHMMIQLPEFDAREIESMLLETFQPEGMPLKQYVEDFLSVLVSHKVIREI